MTGPVLATVRHGRPSRLPVPISTRPPATLLEPVQAALAAGQREQRGDEPFLLLARCQRSLAGGAQRLGAGLGVPERDLKQGPLPGQRRAQLVRGVRDELALGPERGVQPGQQLVEGVTEFLEFIFRAGHRDPLMQAARRDPPGRGRDCAQRAEHPPGHQPAQAHRGHRHDPKCDPRLDEQLVHRASAHPHRHLLQQRPARLLLRSGPAGAAASHAVVSVPMSASLTIGAIALAVVLAIAGGLLAGTFGGWRAARLRPAAALARLT